VRVNVLRFVNAVVVVQIDRNSSKLWSGTLPKAYHFKAWEPVHHKAGAGRRGLQTAAKKDLARPGPYGKLLATVACPGLGGGPDKEHKDEKFLGKDNHLAATFKTSFFLLFCRQTFSPSAAPFVRFDF
jgi:hypothetical protein